MESTYEEACIRASQLLDPNSKEFEKAVADEISRIEKSQIMSKVNKSRKTWTEKGYKRGFSEGHKEGYRKGVDEYKIEIVPNGIDLSEYENLPDKGIFRKKYGIKSNEKIVLFLGRIHKIKGVDLLVEAFSDLVNKMEDAKLVIAGPDDGFLSTLRAQIEDLKIGGSIIFTGPLYEMDKLEAYVDADVYVLPSVYETFPVTVLEACACGTPVIVTDRCGISDIVEKVGYVVEYDKEQLRDAMFKMLSDDGLKRRFGEEGRRLVMEEFGWDLIVGEIERVYLSLIGR